MNGEMTSNRPYLLRALYSWISDNSMTPHVLVDAEIAGVEVPDQAIQKGKVILNIDQAAVHELELGNEWLTFNARFSGKRHAVTVPIDAILAIYSKENGQGMMFALDDETVPPTDPDGGSDLRDIRRPHLTVVK
jgi:stringent starvation protein B